MTMQIMGSGSYLPETIITNDYFKKTDQNLYDGLVDYFQGSKERRHAQEKETALYMAIEAGKDALKNCNFSPEEIDLLLTYIQTPTYLLPMENNLVLKELKLTNAVAFDINTCCASFVSMMNLSNSLISSGKYKKILCVCSTATVQSIVDKSRDYSAFGDGSGAVVFAKSDKSHYIAGNDVTYPEFFEFNWLKNPIVTGKQEKFEFSENPNIGLIALKAVPPEGIKLFKQSGYSPESIDWFITHQPGIKSIEMWCNDLSIPYEKNLNTYEIYANMGAPNIPVTLNHFIHKKEKIKKGDTILFLVPGSGMHISSAIIKY